jgi:hypothetical protein
MATLTISHYIVFESEVVFCIFLMLKISANFVKKGKGMNPFNLSLNLTVKLVVHQMFSKADGSKSF